MSYPKYMMGTKAIHSLGDISRPEPSLCVIHKEEDDNYVGNWVTGFGFVEVKFPKDTTRDLTTEEVEKFHGQPIVMNNELISFVNTKDEPFGKEVTVTRHADGKVYAGKLYSPLKVGGMIYVLRENARFFRSSRIEQLTERMGANNGYVAKTKNSTYTIEYVKDEAQVSA